MTSNARSRMSGVPLLKRRGWLVPFSTHNEDTVIICPNSRKEHTKFMLGCNYLHDSDRGSTWTN